MECSHNGLCYLNENEQSVTTHKIKDESQRHNVEWKSQN